MRQSRFLTASEFAKQLSKFHVYGDHVWPKDLEDLERLRLVIPQYRIRYPDPVSRRLYCESRAGQFVSDQVIGELEPDSARWAVASGIEVELHRMQLFEIYGHVDHPLLNFKPEYQGLVEIPADLPFVPWAEFYVDVSSTQYPDCSDGSFVRSYYSSWQLLLAAEVADTGIHIRCNLADGSIDRLPTEEYLLKNWLPTVLHSSSCKFVADVLRKFKANEIALNAGDCFADQASQALDEVLKGRSSGRFIVQGDDLQKLRDMETSAAKKIVSDCSLTLDQLVAHIQLLAERWSHWHDKGRPAVAAAYRQFAYTSIEFIRLAYNIALDDLKQKVGLVGGYRRLILDVIWPDWEDEEKQRLMRTLSSAVRAGPVYLNRISGFISEVSAIG